jgi:outer membrane protein
VGAGLNYTAFTSVTAPPGITITRSSTGLAFQAGVDVPLGKSVYANLDVKKIFIGTKVSSAGAQLGEFKIDPWLVGVGVGYRF